MRAIAENILFVVAAGWALFLVVNFVLGVIAYSWEAIKKARDFFRK